MLPAERQRRIVALVEEQGGASVQALAAALGVSIPTIRRDLVVLEKQRLLSRTHGGAVPVTRSTSFEPVYSEKRRLHRLEKQRIGRRAAEMVADGDTIILDSGSTTFEIARHLHGKKGLTVATNDLYIAQELGGDPEITVLITGGMLRVNYFSIVGMYAEEMLRQLHVNKAFLGADAVHSERGVTNATVAEAAMKRLMVAAADRTYLVADHSKFGQEALAHVVGLEQLYGIIADNRLEAATVAQLKERTPVVILV